MLREGSNYSRRAAFCVGFRVDATDMTRPVVHLTYMASDQHSAPRHFDYPVSLQPPGQISAGFDGGLHVRGAGAVLRSSTTRPAEVASAAAIVTASVIEAAATGRLIDLVSVLAQSGCD